jgi:hypothetical protein
MAALAVLEGFVVLSEIISAAANMSVANVSKRRDSIVLYVLLYKITYIL